jgi:hypothetical protein
MPAATVVLGVPPDVEGARPAARFPRWNIPTRAAGISVRDRRAGRQRLYGTQDACRYWKRRRALPGICFAFRRRFGLIAAHNASDLPMRFLACILLAGSVISSVAAAQPVSLFDGKTFNGWEGDTKKTFRIQEGAIVGGTLNERIPRNEFLCSIRPYTNFVLRLKFKLIGEGANAGVQIRTKRISNPPNEVSGYQADMGDPTWWGCLYDESRRNKVLAKSNMEEVNKVLKRNDWNDYVIRCEGKRIQLWINGLQTVDYTEPDDKIEQTGVIAVQIHSGPPSEAWYKDISIEELP